MAYLKADILAHYNARNGTNYTAVELKTALFRAALRDELAMMIAEEAVVSRETRLAELEAELNPTPPPVP